MKLEGKFVMNNSINLTNPNFCAKQRALYKLANGETVKLLELEKKDLSFIKNFSQNIDSYMDKKEIETVTDKRLIIDTSFKIIKEMLEMPAKLREKTRMFLAVSNNDICGVLVGGMPKKTAQKSIKHSSRKFARDKETELNWCAAWDSDSKHPRKGVGKIMLSEYIDTVKKDGFKKLFIQSEIPELSYAKKFYESMGCKEMPCGQSPHRSIEQNKDIVNCVEDLYDYDIVPMLGNLKDISKAKEQAFSRYQREVLPQASVDLYKEIKTV